MGNNQGGLTDILGVGTKTKSTQEVINDIVFSISAKTVSECITSATQEQIIRANNISGNFVLSGSRLTQSASVDVQCLQSSSKQTELLQNISAALTNFLESKGVAALSGFGSTRAEAESRIKNKLQQEINADTINRAIASINLVQGIEIQNVGGNAIIENVTLEQTSALVAKNIANAVTNTRTAAEIAATADTVAKSTESNPLDPIRDIAIGGTLAAISPILIGAVIFLIVLSVIFAIFVIKQRQKSGSAAFMPQNNSESIFTSMNI